MYHINRLTRIVSYISALLLIVYFIISGLNISESHILLYIATAWFGIYGILLSSTKNTVAYYKIFIIVNIFTVIAGYTMYFASDSQAGYMIIAISVSMLAFVITFSRR